MQLIGQIAKSHTNVTKKGEEQLMSIDAFYNNMEKYMTFMLVNNLTFINSFQFMSSSLDKLVSSLPNESLKYTSEKFRSKN